MAIVYGANATKGLTADTITMIPRGMQGGAVNVVYDSYECSSTAATTQIYMGSELPDGAVILMHQLTFDDLGTSVTIDIGTAYNDDEFASAINVASAAGSSTVMLVDGAGYVVGTAATDNQLMLTINTAAATGTVKLVTFYSLQDIMAEVLRSPERRLVIVGDGETRAEDFSLASRTSKYYEIMIINKVVNYVKHYHHWVSYHPELFTTVAEWKGLTHSNVTTGIRPKVLWKHSNEGGTSALFAVHIAKMLGYNKIVLCGCPFSGEYSADTIFFPWKMFKAKNEDWCKASIRSYSGKTKDLLGDAKGWW